MTHMSSTHEKSVEWWAHQDSNLERAGYEPAALTVELWALANSLERIQNGSIKGSLLVG